MGALRAIELESFGMLGVGRIAEWYRTGVVAADDEVALRFAPDSLEALTVPLVCMRVALQEAVAKGLVNDLEATELLEVGKSLHYRDRTYFELISRNGLGDARRDCLLEFLMHEATDQKAEDARRVLGLVVRAGAGADRRLGIFRFDPVHRAQRLRCGISRLH